MPGWGTGSFENEDAQNFLGALQARRPEDLKEILVHADRDDYLAAAEGSVVVAAAEVIATAKGAPPPTVPRQMTDWLGGIEGAPSTEMSEIARRAVNRVRLNSELKDLWLQADGLNEWSAALRDLEERLNS
jgi:hypothetical protein